MDELDKIFAASKAQAAAGTERIAFDPMALAYAIEQGIAARVAAERERMRALVADDASAATYQSLGQYRTALLRALRA
ncbi:MULTISPECIES: hypothetical protein [unclassified Synechococcus]|uniref:hypothetical protein n=1 Tax=unclassified Synechococcus TaxID=2626047 RepID=UPI001C22C67F|nr:MULTISPECIES: hypothetical protein [unclassified Synechococcus]